MVKEDADGNKSDEMHYFFRPSKTLDLKIIEITKLSDDYIKDRPNFKDHINDIVNFISNETLVGHNIVSFDLRFLNDNLSQYRIY